jgi:hypothetical protein
MNTLPGRISQQSPWRPTRVFLRTSNDPPTHRTGAAVMKLNDALNNEQRAARLLSLQSKHGVIPKENALSFVMLDFQLKPSWLNEMFATQEASLICSGDYDHNPDGDDRPY